MSTPAALGLVAALADPVPVQFLVPPVAPAAQLLRQRFGCALWRQLAPGVLRVAIDRAAVGDGRCNDVAALSRVVLVAFDGWNAIPERCTVPVGG